jgi:hypothetical protein
MAHDSSHAFTQIATNGDDYAGSLVYHAAQQQ